MSPGSHADVPQNPRVRTEKGFWSYSPPAYAETTSPNTPPLVVKIRPESATSFSYKIGEDEYGEESKEAEETDSVAKSKK